MSSKISLKELEKVLLFHCKKCDNTDYVSEKEVENALIIFCDDCGEAHYVEENN